MVQLSSVYLLGAAMSVRACTGPPANQATIDLVTSFEKFVPDIYTDATGHPTVGYGHLCSDASCSGVQFSIPLSEADGKILLGQDMTVTQDCITNDTAKPVTLNANQYGALVSWAFNVGCGAAGSSTLIQRLNAGEDPGTVVKDELPQWDKGNGEVLEGLVRRRKAELDLFNTPTTDPALPAAC